MSKQDNIFVVEKVKERRRHRWHDFYIREHTPECAIVADRSTGYVVAQFFYQKGYNAVVMATEFIGAMKDLEEEKRWQTL
jgi:hypothetical protein